MYFQKLKLVILLCVIYSLFMCSQQKPTSYDATGSIQIIVIDTTGLINPQSHIQPVGECRVRFFNTNYSTMCEGMTDEQGMVTRDGLLAGFYNINAEKKVNHYLLTGSIELEIDDTIKEGLDTIKVDFQTLSGIVINEIFYAGSQRGYYEDQFIELYNNSDSVQYLDGIIVCRLLGITGYPEQQIISELHYQFPGTGSDFPIMPGEFVVIARKAIDHITKSGKENSLDLSAADWEFFNEYSSHDIDNLAVPNLENLSAFDNEDFRMNLMADEICILKTKDFDAAPDYNYYGKNLKIFSVFDVLDGVEYASNPSHEKSLDFYLDVGLAGYSVEQYSGKSIERESAGTGDPGHDTNNSTFDFVTIKRSTPGYQHSADLVIPRDN